MEKYPPTKIWFIGKQKTDKKVSISPKFPRLLPRHLLVTDCHKVKTMDWSCFWEAPQYFNLRLPCWALSNPSNIRRGAKVSCKLPILIWRGIDGWTLGLARHRALYWSWLISLSLSPSLSPDFNCYGQHYSKQCFPCTPYLQRLAQHIIYENGVLSSLRLLQQLDRNFFRESKLTPWTHFRSEWGL